MIRFLATLESAVDEKRVQFRHRIFEIFAFEIGRLFMT